MEQIELVGLDFIHLGQSKRLGMGALGRRGQLRAGLSVDREQESVQIWVQEERAFDSQVGWGHVRESRKSNRI